VQSEFNSTSRAKQLLDFNNLIDGNLGASDIDAIVDYHNSLWIITEVKLLGKDVPFGQNLMLNRLAADLEKTGKPVLLIVAEHNILDANENIVLKDCIVRNYKIKGERHTPKRTVTVGEFVNASIKILEAKKLAREPK
jgi:hypothetical protein